MFMLIKQQLYKFVHMNEQLEFIVTLSQRGLKNNKCLQVEFSTSGLQEKQSSSSLWLLSGPDIWKEEGFTSSSLDSAIM